MRNMRRIGMLLVAVCLLVGLLALPASAATVASGSCGDAVTWKLTDDGTLTISGSGAMTLGKQWERPWIDHLKSIKKLVIQSGVTDIAEGTAYGCVNLTQVVIGDTVSAIRGGAFYGCTALKEFHITAGVTYIDTSAFDGCTALKAFSVDPENQEYAVDGRGVLFDKEMERLYRAPAMLSGTYAIPEGVESVSSSAFEDCSGLTGVTVPGTVTWLGYHVFRDCTGLKTAVLEPGVPKIGAYMFYGCKALTSVTIPDSVTEIGELAFANCASLGSVYIPAGVTELESDVYYGCESLTAFRVAADSETFSQGPSGELLSKDKTILYRVPGAVTEYTFPKTVVTLYGRAFQNCRITSVTIPKRVSVLSWTQMFYGCDRLESVIVRSPITTLVSNTFNECNNLLHVELPATLTTVEGGAFGSGKALKYVDFAGTKAQWEAVEIRESNVRLMNASVHYNAGKSGHTVTKTVVKPTCGVQGYTLHTCKCGYQRRSDYTAALLHNYKQTGVQDGYRSFKCGKCGDTYTDSDPGNTPLTDRNEGYQDYTTWSSTVESYLEQNADGTYTRVQFSGEQIYIEEYSSDFAYLSTRTMAPELPLFGGYYTDGTHRFLVFGQNNLEEDNALEVIRVVKYSMSWKRQGSASLYGGNTHIPFRAGSLRMASCGNALYIRTSHQMFQADDGRNHQANLNLILNIKDMTLVTDHNTSDYQYSGYVSHSFNQFILVDGDDVIALDHGDAFPRSMVLCRVGLNAGETEFSKQYQRTAVLWLSGATGKNATGAAVGGLEASSSSYLTAGISIAQDGTENYGGQHNLYITVTDKETFGEEGDTIIRWLTDYPQGEMKVDVSTPHLVKLGTNKFCVLWTETNMGTHEEQLCYAFLNGKGKVQGKIYRSDVGLLSECKPIVADGKIVWYVTRYYQPDFYCIDPAAPGTVVRRHDHSYVAYTDAGGAECICSGCGKEYRGALAARAGSVAQFESELYGESYQWYYRTSSEGKWIKCTAPGNQTSVLRVSATCAKSGYQYRCKVTDYWGVKNYTKAVTLYVLGVRTQPTAQAVKTGTTATFKVTATGVDKRFQWQFRTSEDGAWQNATAKGNKTATLKVPATVAKSGFQYRCKITDSRGNVVYTRTVKLFVLGIKTQPTGKTVKAGNTATFKVVATGLNKTYQWQYKAADGTWKNCTVKGSRTASLTVTAAKNNNGRQYRCRITDGKGHVIYTNTVKLTLK